MIAHKIPNRSTQKLRMDILEFDTKVYLVVINYMLKWFELSKIKYKSSEGIIRHLINIFLIHGAPNEIICDNNLFNSNNFKNFCK